MSAITAQFRLAHATLQRAPRPDREVLAELLAPGVAALVEDMDACEFDVVENSGDKDAWGVGLLVKVHGLGTLQIRYEVPWHLRDTCRAAHGGFDVRMASVVSPDYALEAMSDLEGALVLANEARVHLAILDVIQKEGSRVGRELLLEATSVVGGNVP